MGPLIELAGDMGLSSGDLPVVLVSGIVLVVLAVIRVRERRENQRRIVELERELTRLRQEREGAAPRPARSLPGRLLRGIFVALGSVVVVLLVLGFLGAA